MPSLITNSILLLCADRCLRPVSFFVVTLVNCSPWSLSHVLVHLVIGPVVPAYLSLIIPTTMLILLVRTDSDSQTPHTLYLSSSIVSNRACRTFRFII